ncbi:MAG: pyrroloquinoline quinone biosynthesis protein PqqE [Deltaproteobacteria bacterium]|nr:pyrroloquinoline quinone biosynthesis protein PqqE [Deltaproteobacteria bacterium]
MTEAGSTPTLDGQGRPLWLLCELTYACPLACPWCSNPLDFDRLGPELSTAEWRRVLAEARALGALQLGFSGGEPCLRKDLEELVAHGDELGYYTNLITSGLGLTGARLARLKEAGLRQVQLSLQACDPELGDRMVGGRAAAHKLAIAREIKAQGFPVVLNVPLSRDNIDQVDGILALAEELGVEFLELANVQYYNWALVNRAELLPTRAQLAKAEASVAAARQRLGRRMTLYYVVPDYHDGRPKACMNGWGSIHLTIGPDGAALPCQEARAVKSLEFPNVREHALAWIWRDSPAFNAFRGDAWMKDPCRSCDERGRDFGGCRCQALLLTGDAANTDPVCARSPHRHLVDEAVALAEDPARLRGRLLPRAPRGG